MAENPLLPHAKLRDLYARMVQAQALARRGPAAGLEAVIAPLLMHAGAHDAVLGGVASGVIATMQTVGTPTPSAKPKRAKQAVAATAAPGGFALAAGAAMAMQLTGGGAAFALLDPTLPDATWRAALSYITAERLPLLLLLATASTSTAKRARSGTAVPSWQALSSAARPLHLPVLPVDADDAVAVYRVLQESVLRVRTGGGPAVIWCARVPASPQRTPLDRMRRYLAARKIEITGEITAERTRPAAR